ncbi:MAG: hypothetical protein WAK12_03630 [Acidimicrobiales bacterium]
MLLIILALFWVALLVPIVIRRFREGGTEKSIQSFHAEHEVLSQQDYLVAPAHRLDRPDSPTPVAPSTPHRPHLTVVHADDTFGTLESRSSWDEWHQDYEYDDTTGEDEPVTNHYARAYSSRPSEPIAKSYESPLRRRTMQAQRRVIFARLVLVAIVVTLAAYFIGSSIVVDLAALAWFSVVCYVALALFAVSQGYLDESSLPVRIPRRRQLATIAPLYAYGDDEYAPEYETEFSSEYYEPEVDEGWRRDSQRRSALG